MAGRVKVKLNANLRGYKKGQSINIQVDGAGVPLDAYWRRRFKDAERDRCIELWVPEIIEVDNPAVIVEAEPDAPGMSENIETKTINETEGTEP